MSKEELLKIAKGRNLRSCVNYTKSQLINRLRDVGVLAEGVNENDKDKERYKFIKRIREGSKKVEVEDLESGEVKTYPSIYGCAKALNVNPGTIRFFNRRLYDNTYLIKILEEF